jgi:hypothetical protein
MRTLTNDYRDAQIMDLGSEGQRGPYLVTQSGVSPNEQIPKTHLFILRPDGCWVDFNAYACQGKPEAMDELVFTDMAQVMGTFSTLSGKPRVLELPINKEGLAAWLERQKGRDPLQAARDWALHYKERRSKGK